MSYKKSRLMTRLLSLKDRMGNIVDALDDSEFTESGAALGDAMCQVDEVIAILEDEGEGPQ